MRRRRFARAIVLGGALAAAGLLGAEALRAQTPPAAPPAAPGARPGPRDPFAPLVQPAPPGGAPGARPQHEITGLRLVGVVWEPRDAAAIRALVETPDGLGYYLRVNEEKFGGTVVTIQQDLVRFTVEERVPGGPSRTRTVELKLPKPEAQP